MASEIFDLPEPFGPTMAVISRSKVSRVFSGKDLKPWISNALKYKLITSTAVWPATKAGKILYYSRAHFAITIIATYARPAKAPLRRGGFFARP